MTSTDILIQDIQSRFAIGGALALIVLILLFIAIIVSNYIQEKSKKNFEKRK